MQYREFGKNKNKVSILGFGCMRFPVDEEGLIDREKSEEMLLEAIKGGVNYIDTAYPYHGGESELFVGEFVKKHNLRDQVFIATKLPSWLIHSRADMEKLIKEQLEKLQTEYIDYFLLHALNKDHWKNYKENGVFEYIQSMLDLGLIKDIGFSFHDEYPVFKEIIDDFDGWSFCQIQLNFMDEDYQAGLKGLNYAAEKGIDVIVMEPLKGGNLTKNVPDDVMAIWEQGQVKRTPARWALDYVWQFESVKLVLSGMSTLEQVKDNLLSAANHDSNISAHDREIITQVAKIYNDRTKVPCTGCNYCMPCPFGVNIPEVFSVYNQGSRYNNMDGSKWQYNNPLKESNASKCTTCGVCIEKCPQFIQIPDRLAEAHEILKA